MKLNLSLLELILLLVISLLSSLWTRYGRRIRKWWEERRKRRRGPRQLRPRQPEDCPDCARGIHWLPRRLWPEVVPWSEVKSRRGRKKIIDTSSYACLNIWCRYFGVADATIHALVSDGWRGKHKDILYLRCQACHKKTTSRAGTPMYRIKTPLHQVAMVMTALSEGVDLSAASRIFGLHPTTISRWLERAGQHSQRLHERLFFQAIHTGHIQLDELYTRVKSEVGTVFVWSAITAQSKLIIALHIGGQAIEDACQLFHQIKLRLVEGCKPVFTSDGRNQYFHGLTAHFGYWDKPPRARKYHWFPDDDLLYAQLRKERRGRKVRFLYSIIRLGTRTLIGRCSWGWAYQGWSRRRMSSART